MSDDSTAQDTAVAAATDSSPTRPAEDAADVKESEIVPVVANGLTADEPADSAPGMNYASPRPCAISTDYS